MTNRSSILLLLIFFLLMKCGTNFKKDFVDKFQQGPNGEKIPEPKFDRPVMDILKDLKNKYDATSVRIGRPFTYSTGSDLKYWIKVAFVNPELSSKSIREFEKEIATNTIKHLTNPVDFQKIEIAVTQKKGFIITFSKSENVFFYIDSLRMNK